MDRYRLAPLREVRERDERGKRNDLAAAVGDARATEHAVTAAETRVVAARAALADALAARKSLRDAHLLALADRYVARRRHALEAAVMVHTRACAAHDGKVAVIDHARAQLTAARANKELIERHFARWRDARAKLRERRED